MDQVWNELEHNVAVSVIISKFQNHCRQTMPRALSSSRRCVEKAWRCYRCRRTVAGAFRRASAVVGQREDMVLLLLSSSFIRDKKSYATKARDPRNLLAASRHNNLVFENELNGYRCFHCIWTQLKGERATAIQPPGRHNQEG